MRRTSRIKSLPATECRLEFVTEHGKISTAEIAVLYCDRGRIKEDIRSGADGQHGGLLTDRAENKEGN